MAIVNRNFDLINDLEFRIREELNSIIKDYFSKQKELVVKKDISESEKAVNKHRDQVASNNLVTPQQLDFLFKQLAKSEFDLEYILKYFKLSSVADLTCKTLNDVLYHIGYRRNSNGTIVIIKGLRS